MLVMHIPTTTSTEDRKKFSYKESGATMANKTALYKMLSPYKAHIISGHTHTAANQQINDNIFEYNLPALSGAWWQGSLCTDGAPKGYGVFIAEGNEITWHYHSTGEKESYQMRLYTGRDDNSFNGYVVANIWNSDSSWRVELYEDGVSKGSMERFSAYDPDAKKMYSDRRNLSTNGYIRQYRTISTGQSSTLGRERLRWLPWIVTEGSTESLCPNFTM